MTLTFTGTASGIPVAHRRHASLLVEQDGEKHLVDAGEGIASTLAGDGDSLHQLARIWISHTHADHVSGLPMLLQGMHLAGRIAPLDIMVPPGREQWFEDWLEGLYMFREKWSFSFYIRGFDTSPVQEHIGVHAFPNRHLDKVRNHAASHGIPAQAWSFVIRGGANQVLVTSDIAGMDDIAELLPGVDTLIADSAHIETEALFDLARLHGALMIFCTHIPPELEPELDSLRYRSTASFGGRVMFAHDGMRISTQADGMLKQDA